MNRKYAIILVFALVALVSIDASARAAICESILEMIDACSTSPSCSIETLLDLGALALEGDCY